MNENNMKVLYDHQIFTLQNDGGISVMVELETD